MTDKKTQELWQVNIDHLVEHFYERATRDVLIGYQFRKIAQEKGAHPLAPPMEAFRDHLPRIQAFWRLQLGVMKPGDREQSFDLLNVHDRLRLNPGELDRWLVLFRESLRAPELALSNELIEALEEKIARFDRVFKERLWKA